MLCESFAIATRAVTGATPREISFNVSIRYNYTTVSNTGNWYLYSSFTLFSFHQFCRNLVESLCVWFHVMLPHGQMIWRHSSQYMEQFNVNFPCTPLLKTHVLCHSFFKFILILLNTYVTKFGEFWPWFSSTYFPCQPFWEARSRNV